MQIAERSEPLPHGASLALGIIVFHLVVSVLHGTAHLHYELPLARWQHAYILVVIFIAPLVSGGLLLWRQLRAGAGLLLLSMGGALVFGVYFHFLLIGPDHISSVGLYGWGFLFMASAIFLAAIEAWGVTVAVRLLRASRGKS
jgi:hypothetical protein